MRWETAKYNRDRRISRDTQWEFDTPVDRLRFDMEIAFANGEASPDSATWFTARLFRLMRHADGGNLDKLAKGFPEAVALFRKEWLGEG